MRIFRPATVVALPAFLASLSLGPVVAAPPATQQTSSTRLTTGPTRDQLQVAGFDSADEIRQFLDQLQRAVAHNDDEAAVALVRYPFRLYSQGKVRKLYASKEALLADFGGVFTPTVRKQIVSARFETLFLNYQGAMIGRGALWFDKREQTLGVCAVNP